MITAAQEIDVEATAIAVVRYLALFTASGDRADVGIARELLKDAYETARNTHTDVPPVLQSLWTVTSALTRWILLPGHQ